MTPTYGSRLDSDLHRYGFEGLAFSTVIADPNAFVNVGSFRIHDGLTHFAYAERSKYVPYRTIDLFVTPTGVLHEAYVTERDPLLGDERTEGIVAQRDGSLRLVNGERKEFIRPHYVLASSFL